MIIKGSFVLKPKIYFSENALSLLKDLSGHKAFIVADAIMQDLGYLQKTIDYLDEAGIKSEVFSDIYPDPDIALVANGIKKYSESEADVLIALGGGSAIDTAKAILYFESGFRNKNKVYKKPTFVAIPSTSGTGSEVTDFSVITSNDEKVCIVDNDISPDIAILDPTCIQHVPSRVVADTGIDVLVHSLEAYVSKDATDFTDALAEKAIQLIFENLEIIYKDINNIKARSHVHNASCMAGIAFTNTGLGINHSLAHAFGGKFHISHGRSNALMLKSVIEFNSGLKSTLDEYSSKKYSNIAKILNLPARTSREGVVSLISEIERLKKNIGIENSIRDIGIKEEDFSKEIEVMAETALKDRCTASNPKLPTKEDLIEIYNNCC
ncbi:1-propanol dehydrogenase PduQ [Acetoanaerobium pronyense]